MSTPEQPPRDPHGPDGATSAPAGGADEVDRAVPDQDAPEPVAPEPVAPEPVAPEPVAPEAAQQPESAATVAGPEAPDQAEPALPSASELLAQSAPVSAAVGSIPAEGPEGVRDAGAPDVDPVPPPTSADVDGPPVATTVDRSAVDDDVATTVPTDDLAARGRAIEPSATEPRSAGTDVSVDGDLTPARRRLLAGLVAAAVVVALLAAGVGYLGLRLRAEAGTDSARSEAVAASRDAARLLFSYDFKTLQDDFARGLAVTTGAFREEYSRTTRDVVSDVATEYKAVVLADVVESAVIEASPSKVTTLVFLNQATTSTRVQGQQIDGSRVRMVLEKRDGRWLVSAVDAL